MFSKKLKRPALALAVTAGLLAVAGPASAGTTNEPKGGPPTKATPSIIVYDFEGEPVHQVPHGRSIGTSEVFELNTFGGDDTLSARGTQVGSEGVKNGNAGDDTLIPISPDGGSGDDNLRGEAIDIIP